MPIFKKNFSKLPGDIRGKSRTATTSSRRCVITPRTILLVVPEFSLYLLKIFTMVKLLHLRSVTCLFPCSY